MKKLTFEEIKERIDNYVANGGSIYDERRSLPYYDNLIRLTKRIRQTSDPNFTIVDAYKMFGYDFDREYDDYCRLINVLQEYTDTEGYVDKLKETSGANSPNDLLKKMSATTNCSPSDYLILMTDYRYKKSIISTNYIDQLRKELQLAYPTGDINNIKRENPTLYNKLRHVCKYSPEIGFNDMQSIAEFFGLTNSRFSDKSIYQHLNTKKILNEINQLFPDKKIDIFAKTHPTLYFKATKCATSQNKTLRQWLEEHGYTYTQAQNTDRLSKTIVDGKVREQEIANITSKIVGNSQPKFDTPIEKYYYKKKLAQLVISQLDQPIM